MAKGVTFREYVHEILQNATYKACENSDCIIAFVEVLPGCMTQGDTFEDARELLIDAIELWILSAIKDGEDLPVVNACKLDGGQIDSGLIKEILRQAGVKEQDWLQA
jgi:predicted RNase H-like HicB family nuclease